jgi:hypothetical protein
VQHLIGKAGRGPRGRAGAVERSISDANRNAVVSWWATPLTRPAHLWCPGIVFDVDMDQLARMNGFVASNHPVALMAQNRSGDSGHCVGAPTQCGRRDSGPWGQASWTLETTQGKSSLNIG